MTTPADRYAAFRDRQAARNSPPSARSTTSTSTTSRSPPAARSARATACWWPRRPARARRWSASTPSHLALAQGRKCFYTTPIKALSNQKYADLVRRYDSRTVGLLTGDNSINGDAPVVVMTTEVLRNMLYAGLAGAVRPRLRRARRGALPGRPLPRRGLGRSDHPPARVGAGGRAVRDGEQRRGVRRLAGPGPRRHRRSSWTSTGRSRCGSTCWPGTGCTTCSPTTTHTPGQPRAASGSPSGTPGSSARRRRGPAAATGRPRRFPPAYRPDVIVAARLRRACCPRSRSSSAGPAATPPSSSAWSRACG